MASPSQQPQQASANAVLGRMAVQSQIEFELEFFAAILGRRPDFVEGLKAHGKTLPSFDAIRKGCIATAALPACGRTIRWPATISRAVWS